MYIYVKRIQFSGLLLYRNLGKTLMILQRWNVILSATFSTLHNIPFTLFVFVCFQMFSSVLPLLNVCGPCTYLNLLTAQCTDWVQLHKSNNVIVQMFKSFLQKIKWKATKMVYNLGKAVVSKMDEFWENFRCKFFGIRHCKALLHKTCFVQ